MRLQDLEWTDPETLAALESGGIEDTDQLLAAAGPAASRRALAASTGLSEDTLKGLAHRADLMRLPKLVEGYTVLLEKLDLGTRERLAQCDGATLLRALRRTNIDITAVRSIQPESILADWIHRAATEPTLVEDAN